MNNESSERRRFLVAVGSVGASALVVGGRAAEVESDDVTANEDLMREHGIIRRALLIYGEAARRARKAPASVPLSSLAHTAALFRRFAEDYHERALEETHIFPVVRKINGPASKLADVLQAQHQRGREITDYVRQVSSRRALGAGAERLATVLEGFIRMYEPHAAREDTELFPAWKAALGSRAYAEMGERFEDIEHKTFGHDGFDDALAEIRTIEVAFGLADLAAATPPAPPR
jgi:hemerythrin-like domain-containing protein